MICNIYKLKGNIAKFYRIAPNNTTTTLAVGGSQNYFECNHPVLFKKDCPKLKNQGGRGREFTVEDLIPISLEE